jgi:hypothetical protein
MFPDNTISIVYKHYHEHRLMIINIPLLLPLGHQIPPITIPEKHRYQATLHKEPHKQIIIPPLENLVPCRIILHLHYGNA